jgi:hypothetical protein
MITPTEQYKANKTVVDNRLPAPIQNFPMTTTLNPVAEWRSR